MDASLAERLEALVGRPVCGAVRLSGGDVAAAWRVDLSDRTRVFAKSGPGLPAGALAAEARGLAWLAEAAALAVPQVLGLAEADPAAALLVLEWIEPSAPGGRIEAAACEEAAGVGLAALHRAGAPYFGFAADNFLATLPQANTALPSWPRFYVEQRLAPLLKRARDVGQLDAGIVRRFSELFSRVEERVGPAEPPARLHGDLWGGNRLVDPEGRSWLIDPAVYGGHREMDLAMMRLFGGFGPRCFEAYDEAHPLAPGHAERVPLYQLYPLLAHVNLFGASYRGRLETALARCL